MMVAGIEIEKISSKKWALLYPTIQNGLEVLQKVSAQNSRFGNVL